MRKICRHTKSSVRTKGMVEYPERKAERRYPATYPF